MKSVPVRIAVIAILAAAVVAGALLMIDPEGTGSGAGARGAHSCKGGISGSDFRLSCDVQLGGNPAGALFTASAMGLTSLEVSAPTGISCRGNDGRYACAGMAVPPGTTIAGSFTRRVVEGEEGELEEEGDGCAGGVRMIVIAYGSEVSEEFEEEEEGEGEGEGGEAGPTPVPVARTVIDSCGAPEGGEKATPTLRLGRPKLDRKRGTARLPVTVSGAGRISLGGRSVANASIFARAKGAYHLPVRARGHARAVLKGSGHVTVRATVTFTATHAESVTRSLKLTLRLR